MVKQIQILMKKIYYIYYIILSIKFDLDGKTALTHIEKLTQI